MAQKRGKNQYGIRTFIILLVVVIAGGVFLWTQGSLTAPLETTSMILSTSQGSEDGFAMAPPEGDKGFTMVAPEGETNQTSTGIENGRPERHADDGDASSLIDFKWSAFSDVLYNLWVMLVATVFVVVIAKPTGWIVKRIKQPRQPSPQA